MFETHSISEDNEAGPRERVDARPVVGDRVGSSRVELGARRRDNGIHTVFSSDLHRALETAVLAFEGLPFPILLDWRLRECDYGDLHARYPRANCTCDRARYLDEPYPNGESWRRGSRARSGRFLTDLPTRWERPALSS